MKMIILIGVICLVLLIGAFIGFNFASSSNKEEPKDETAWIPDSLEGCQKQRAILMDGIENYKQRLKEIKQNG